LEKLGLEYSLFVSTFHLGRYTSRSRWTIPTFTDFIESIMHEQSKLIQMGLINDSKVKQKGKGKEHSEEEEEGNSSDGSLGSKYGNGKKGNPTHGCYNHGSHPESTCMKKQIDLMAEVIQSKILGNTLLRMPRKS
jgi:hypothetical protein